MKCSQERWIKDQCVCSVRLRYNIIKLDFQNIVQKYILQLKVIVSN